MISISILILASFFNCIKSHHFTNPHFVADIATHFNRLGIIHHLPPMERSRVLRYYKTIRNFSGIQTLSFLFQNENNPTKNGSLAEEDLHIFIIDSKYPRQSIKVLEQEMGKRTRKDKEYWLIDISALKIMENATLMLDDLPLDIDDNIYTFKLANHTFVDIWEIYKIKPENNLIVKKFGIWKSEMGLLSNVMSKWQRRKDLTGHHFKIATNPSKPYITEMIPVGLNTDGVITYRMTGLFAEVFDNLQEIMNFSYSLIKPPDGNWGSIQPDGSWNGMVNLLAQRDIDIATTDFTVTHERSAVMTFATPIKQIYHSLFIKNPAETFNYMAYIEPMHWLSWVGIFVLVITVPPLLFMTTRFGKKDPAYHEFTLGKSYVYLCSTLTMRGWNVLPSKPAAQLALFSLLFFGTLMFWHWEAMLISFLATRVIVMPFNDIPELVSDTDFRIILKPSTSFEDAFKFSIDQNWQAAWIQRNREKYMKCEIVATPAKYDFKPYAYGFQKDSPFLPMFNYFINDMKEKGSLEQIQAKYEPALQICPDYSGKSLGFGSVFTAFGVLFFGTGIALILVSLENLSKILGLECIIFENYGVKAAPYKHFGNDLMQLLLNKDEEILTLTNKNSDLKKKISILENNRESVESAWNY